MRRAYKILTFLIVAILLILTVLPLSGQIGKVGINTTLPQAMLHVMDSSVLFSGPIELPPMPGFPPASGAGTRFMWYPDKAAFRAGHVTENQWDMNNIGSNSFASGHSTKAMGMTSTALGHNTSAEGDYSTSMGLHGIAKGWVATALGAYTLANADRSMALGLSSSAFGINSVVMGSYTQANGFSSLVIGEYNDTIVSAQNLTTTTTPLFIIGNGTGLNARSNAMVVRKDGRMGLGTDTPENILDIEGGIAVGTFYSGSLSAPSNGAIIQGNTGIGTPSPVNKLDIEGGLAVGSTYAGTNSAPVNGAIIQGKTGIGTPLVVNMLDVEGGMVIGSLYAGSSLAPTNGLLIEGNVGIGTPNAINKLDVDGGMAIGGYAGSATAPSQGLIIQGFTGIGTHIPKNNLDIEGRLAVGVSYAGSAIAPVNGAIIQGNTGIGTPLVVNTLDVEGGMAVGNTYSGLHMAPSDGLIIQGSTGIGTPDPVNKLDVEGGMAVGSSYSGSITAPANGAVIQGSLGLGTPSPVNKLDIEGSLAVGSGLAGSVTAPTNGMIIEGNVGIGAYSPNRKLHVSTGSSGAPSSTLSVGVFESASNTYVSLLSQSDEESGILFSLPGSSSHGGIIYNNSTYPSSMLFRTNGNITRMTISDIGYVGIGTSNPSEKLHVVGDICYTGSIGGCSDIRYKTNFNRLHDILPQLEKIGAYSYFWKTDEYPDKEFSEERQIGVIAQEIGELFPEIVLTDPQGFLSVDYSRLSVILLAAIQEQQAEIKRLKDLEKRIVLLEEAMIGSIGTSID